MWNRLYNKKDWQLRFKDAGIGNYNYFPNLGVAIPSTTSDHQHEICSIVNEKLNALGLVHNEVKPDNCNLTNVRMLNGEYYPIDMIKIYENGMSDAEFFDIFGGKRKSKKSKVNRKRKSKRKLKLFR
jgi:hypothetical protein